MIIFIRGLRRLPERVGSFHGLLSSRGRVSSCYEEDPKLLLGARD